MIVNVDISSDLYLSCAKSHHSLTDWFEYCMQFYSKTISNDKKKSHIWIINTRTKDSDYLLVCWLINMKCYKHLNVRY